MQCLTLQIMTLFIFAIITSSRQCHAMTSPSAFLRMRTSSFTVMAKLSPPKDHQHQHQQHPSIHRFLFMGKGDGKKKRKKKTTLQSSAPTSSSSSSSTTSTSSPPPPQRVTSDSNLSVRHQIKWAKLKKAAARNSQTSFRQTNHRRTAYRKTIAEEELEQAKLERQRKGGEPNWDVILNATASSPLVMVDGYNVIYQWPRLKKWMTKGFISKARDLLLYDLEELQRLKQWRVEVVFDGFGRSTTGPLGDAPGSKVTRGKITQENQLATTKVTDQGIRVVYSGVGHSADGYIERRCTQAKTVTEGKLTGSLIVVTNDAMIKTVASSAGALCMSSDRMVDELKAVRKGTMYRVEMAVAKVNGHDVRPVKLQGKTMPNTFTKGSVIIEDKRKKKKPKKKAECEKTVTLEDLKKGTTSLPSWAIVPPANTQE